MKNMYSIRQRQSDHKYILWHASAPKDENISTVWQIVGVFPNWADANNRLQSLNFQVEASKLYADSLLDCVIEDVDSKQSARVG